MPIKRVLENNIYYKNFTFCILDAIGATCLLKVLCMSKMRSISFDPTPPDSNLFEFGMHMVWLVNNLCMGEQISVSHSRPVYSTLQMHFHGGLVNFSSLPPPLPPICSSSMQTPPFRHGFDSLQPIDFVGRHSV